ncbi:glutamine-synthetase adenylyltransferase [Rhodobaculum claviforme]|uniref:Glutamine-synthetase adenylyltransferase n=1 Tax=Rhodobaculum claviforme TaxID=1549854 RepID=A0A934WI74_9RHOB|nr:glutamine-synthetase adenylyltransferase [Rhodobaculum claviforme]MBK5926551.1 glutamine-synthetase adenylyltransferase [Rhodobaculum claviforme]
MDAPAPFAARLTRCPLPHDPQAGHEARAALPDAPPEVAELIAGAAGCSPFLRELTLRHADWLAPALAGPPEVALDAALGDADRPLSDLPRALRRAKARVALLVALADLGGVWRLEEVTGALTRLADHAVDTALRALVAEEIRRGKIPGATPDDAATAAGMVVFAMGKMGAAELNYSSDIDLICLFDDDRFDGPAEQMEARAAFIRVTRKLTALIADRTADGYVFRTDLRLRPDASVMPVCLSMEAAERYYESFGRTWERAAWIKARPCAGDLEAGARYMRRMAPFVWRRHLDYAAIQDAHDMRLRIRAHKGLAGARAHIPLEGHDIKLGAGGIREIEFFTQTRQLIAGGRDADLRDPATQPALAQLAHKGWVPGMVAQTLTAAYRAHREVEHRLQMVADAQTQKLPTRPEDMDRLARFQGMGDTDAWRRELVDRLEQVSELTEGFFAPTGQPGARDPDLSEAARALVARWDTYPALRSERGAEIFRRLRPEILSQLMASDDPDAALARFDGFMAGLPAGVQLFSLFEANPQLIDLIVDICATAPRLSQYLARNAAVLDAVIGGDFFAPWPDRAALSAALGKRLAGVADYERKLDAARTWAREWHFRVGVHHLRGLIDAFEAASQYAALAEACVAALWDPVCAEFARRHGPQPGRGAVVLGMGSLGAGRLNAASDLDLIVIYDAAGAEASQGARPLDVKTYFARLTKALVTALAAPMAEGRLYEVDMRLRPSGRQGPVATALAAFCDYQSNDAWTWEHLALTRARAIAGSGALGAEVEAFRRQLLADKGAGARVSQDVADMRRRLAEAKPPRGPWDCRLGPGRLQEIELFAQTAALRAGHPARTPEAQLAAGIRAGWPTRDEGEALLRAYRLCWRLHCAGRLLSDAAPDPEHLGPAATAFLLRETDRPDTVTLARDLVALATAADRIITARLAP